MSENIYAPKLGDSLDEAKRIICGDRQDSYGNPESSFAVIAEFWNTYVQGMSHPDITSQDVANMMVLFKVARCLGQKPSRDNYVDIQGYAAIAADRMMEGEE